MEPEYYANEDSRLQTCQFPIASNRLRRIKEDGADKNRLSLGKMFRPMAEQHSICLHTNSTIYINGAIEARDIEIEMCCEQCQQNFLAKAVPLKSYRIILNTLMTVLFQKVTVLMKRMV